MRQRALNGLARGGSNDEPIWSCRGQMLALASGLPQASVACMESRAGGFEHRCYSRSVRSHGTPIIVQWAEVTD